MKQIDRTFRNGAWGDIKALDKNCVALTDTATRHGDRRKELCVQNMVNDVYSSYVPFIIDAVYSVAHALEISTQASSRGDDGQRKSHLKLNDMQRLLSRVNFTGLTGNVLFDKFGDRHSAFYDIVNFQQLEETNATGLKQVIVGY